MSFRERSEHHAEVDTTMAVARRRASQGAPSGTTIVAGAQTGGRGRLGRSWFSAPGAGLWATVILRPPQRPDNSPITLIGFVCGVAACHAARQLGAVSALLKWPNDVVVGERKLCGILTECEDKQEAAPVVLVGFGLNVAARATLTLPPELDERYIGIADIVSDHEVRVDGALPVLLDTLETWYERWLDEGAAPILAAWRQLDALSGHQVTAESIVGALIVGRADGITNTGALRVVTGQGPSEIIAGDVVRVRPTDGARH